MSNQEKIKSLQLLLKRLFQFEENDLDFGIYRIINLKKKEIGAFIDKELIQTIKEKIKTVEDNSSLKIETDALKKEIETTFGCNIEEAKKKYKETPKVAVYLEKEKDLKKAEKESDIEEEIYDNIVNFFSRYYDKGDFISKRRYSKENKYSIPYNGEEVYLYWANNDQYYIKTSESFKNYSFKLPSLKAIFEVVNEEVEEEQDNVKGENKYFIFSSAEYDQKSKVLIVKFGYRPLNEDEEKEIKKVTGAAKIGKDQVNEYNLAKINEKIGIFGLSDLQKKHKRMDGEESEKTELEWHLNKYTTKNTTDYFIHKDLKKFLEQELDFYIKNELLHVDDIGGKDDLNINLKKIKVFKEISGKIIEFLAQVENFQKKLWEKKKFVISTDYCITLDYINEKYYPEILENKKQIEEWKKLFCFDIDEEAKKLKNTLHGHGKGDKKIGVLKQNPTLQVDTAFFDDNFKYKILSEIDDLDENTNGILINSENFQALNLLLNKYKEKIKCCYIDPPYNRGGDGFLYKDGFSHSSWITMMESRIILLKYFLNDKGIFFTSVDWHEINNLECLNRALFGEENILSHVGCINNLSGRSDDKFFATCHEYLTVVGLDESQVVFNGIKRADFNKYKFEDKISKYSIDGSPLRKTGKNSRRKDRPNLFYPIYISPDKKKLDLEKQAGWIELLPVDTAGEERTWTWEKETFIKNKNTEIHIKTDEDGGVSLHKKDRLKLLEKPKSIMYKSEYSSTTGTSELNDLIPDSGFTNPKAVSYIKDLISISDSGIVLDFFAGSGTTGHAVLKLNKDDEANRKFILVEMGQYFDPIVRPRIQKVIFSDNWKEGKPLDNNGSKKQIIKYQSLEQYEDSLNNIDFKQPNKLVYDTSDYKLKYMLEFESKDSKVFLNLDSLKKPFDYQLKIERNNEQKDNEIDLIETFNYLKGITVTRIYSKKNSKTNYVFVEGNVSDKSILVVWRNIDDKFDPKEEKKFFKEEFKEPFDEVYTNGNSLIPNAKSVDEVFKTCLFN